MARDYFQQDYIPSGHVTAVVRTDHWYKWSVVENMDEVAGENVLSYSNFVTSQPSFT